MFITVTRCGGPFALRVAAAAIAYIAKMPDGVVLHLTSGEHMRVDDEPAKIERLVSEALTPVPVPAASSEDMIREMGRLWPEALHGKTVLIDEGKEDLTERNGAISGIQAAEERTERVRSRGRRS